MMQASCLKGYHTWTSHYDVDCTDACTCKCHRPTERLTRPKGQCLKCHGTGYIGIYAHVSQGLCFDCQGTGKVKS